MSALSSGQKLLEAPGLANILLHHASSMSSNFYERGFKARIYANKRVAIKGVGQLFSV